MGLPSSHVQPIRFTLGPVFTPEVQHLFACRHAKNDKLDLVPFGHSVYKSLPLFPFDESLQQLAYVTHSKTFTLTECTG